MKWFIHQLDESIMELPQLCMSNLLFFFYFFLFLRNLRNKINKRKGVEGHPFPKDWQKSLPLLENRGEEAVTKEFAIHVAPPRDSKLYITPQKRKTKRRIFKHSAISFEPNIPQDRHRFKIPKEYSQGELPQKSQ